MATKDKFIYVKDLRNNTATIPLADIDDIESLETRVQNLEDTGGTGIDTSNFVTNDSLSSTLGDYVTTSDLTSNYYTATQTDGLLASYYTQADITSLLNAKQDTLTAGDNITISGSTISADLSNYIPVSGSRGTLAGYETVGTSSASSLTVTTSSSDTIVWTTSGSCSLTFTAGSTSECAVKVIAVYNSGTTSLTVYNATMVSNADAPSWGTTSGSLLILTAYFIHGQVILGVYHNSEE